MVREIHRCRTPCRRSYVENTDARVGAGGVRWVQVCVGDPPGERVVRTERNVGPCQEQRG
jgi:hypothetical protein